MSSTVRCCAAVLKAELAQYVEQRIQFPSPRLLDFLAGRSLANRSAVLFFAAAVDAFLARIERS